MITPEEVLELYDDNLPDFNTLYQAFQSDDKYYELDFKFELDLPEEQKNKGIVLPTARSNVDSFGYYIDIANARVSVSRKGLKKEDEEMAESLRKFGAGLIFMTNVEGIISPWRVAAKHYPKYGVAWMKTVYDADLWPDKPSTGVDEWLDACKGQLPISITTVNPQCIMFDTATMGRTWVMEIHTKKVKDIIRRYPDWKGDKKKKYKPSDTVEHICYWDKKYRCDLMGGEPVLKAKSGVVPHNYGFVPFVGIDAGLGDVTADNDLSKRFVGINRYLHDLLKSESRDYSITDIIAAQNAWPWGYLKGKNTASVGKLDTTFGTYTPLPDDVEIVDMVPKMPPSELTQHFLTSRNLITENTISPSLKGQSQEGVRSGADRRQIMSAGQYFLRPAGEAFKYRTSQVLNNCARLLKILPGDVRVYSHTPADEFEDIIDRTKIKEPINYHVEFGPTSEEDDYRRHDDDIRSLHEGILTKNVARKRRPDLNVKDLERDELRQAIKASPAFQMFIDETLKMKFNAILAAQQAKEGPPVAPVPPGAPPSGGPPSPGPQLPPQGMNPQTPGMASASRQVPPLGSAAAIQARLQQQRSQVPMTATQGQFGGTARGPNR